MVQLKEYVIEGANAPFTHKQLKRVHLAGVELEGAWLSGNRPTNVVRDSSVQQIAMGKEVIKDCKCHKHNYCPKPYSDNCSKCYNGDKCKVHCPYYCEKHCTRYCDRYCDCDIDEFWEGIKYVGEAVSPALTYEELIQWIMTNSPDVVNNTCGLHVHVSFKSVTDYVKLMTPQFYDYFLKYMEEWGNKMGFPKGHEFWKRLNGDNKYCCKQGKKCVHKNYHGEEHYTNHTPEEQVKAKNWSASRYCQLNFCFLKHGTVENRLFPGFKDPRMIIAALDATLQCYESYLENLSEEEDRISIRISSAEIKKEEEKPVKAPKLEKIKVATNFGYISLPVTSDTTTVNFGNWGRGIRTAD